MGRALGPTEIRSGLHTQRHQPARAGYAAGMVTKTGIIGFMGGVQTEIVEDFYYGFAAGIEQAERERGMQIELLVDYTGSFTDAQLGYDSAMEMYNAGADIVYQVAGTSGTGAIIAAEETGKYVIGVDVDQSYLAPDNVIFSVVKHIPHNSNSQIEQVELWSF